ncbi:hypothetical protein N9F41_00175 [bacterium]|nr:hypothetical protein [bacterium]
MSQILKSRVAEEGYTALLERLGKDCTPTQFIREFAYNSIEAIERTGKPGNLWIDVNWKHFDETGVYKLSFLDTGDGMSGEEMVKYINQLSSSGKKNLYQNYGMGAKISAATRNPAGLHYHSWKDGNGSSIIHSYSDDEDAYGLEPFEQGNEHRYYGSLTESARNELTDGKVTKHGTMVTLMGEDDLQDTMAMPTSLRSSRESWIYKILNERLYTVPENVTIKVRIGYDRDRSNTKHNHMLGVYGQKQTFDKFAEDSGTVELSNAKIHWWILQKNRKGHGRHYLSGSTQVLHQGELFDRTDGRSNRSQLFGIHFGQNNIALVVEPNEKDFRQDTTRTMLCHADGTPLPWEQWGDEFRANMPIAMREYLDAIISQAAKNSHSESIAERLKSLKDFYKISRYKPDSKGSVFVNQNELSDYQTGDHRKGRIRKKKCHGNRKRGKRFGYLDTLLASDLKKDGVKASQSDPNPFPIVKWISIKDSTRVEGELDDRAARFFEKENLIKANADFSGFRDVIDHFTGRFGLADGVEQIVPSVVYEWFEQQLVEAVAGSQSMKNRKHWNPDDFERLTSEEALTAITMPRDLIIREIARNLKKRLANPVIQEAENSVALAQC